MNQSQPSASKRPRWPVYSVRRATCPSSRRRSPADELPAELVERRILV